MSQQIRARAHRTSLFVAACAATTLLFAQPALARAKGLKPASKPAGTADPSVPRVDAEPTQPAPKADKSAPPPPPPPSRTSAAVSAPASRRPILIGNVKFLSLGVPTSFNLGIGAGFNIWKIASLEGDVQAGSQSFSAFGFKLGTLHQTIWTVNARIYPMLGTFNILGAYGRRALKAELDLADLDFSTDVLVEQKVAAAGLGNRWFIGPFFIGADWLVVHWPVGKSDVSSQLLGQQLTEEQQEDVDKAVDLMDGMPTVTLFNVHAGLGW